MQAIPEGHVDVYLARDVEPVSIGKFPIVAVSRTVPQAVFDVHRVLALVG